MRRRTRITAGALLIAGGLLVGGLPASAAGSDTGTDGTRVTDNREYGTDGTRVTGTDNRDW